MKQVFILFAALISLASCGSSRKDVQCTVKATGYEMQYKARTPSQIAFMNSDTTSVICKAID